MRRFLVLLAASWLSVGTSLAQELTPKSTEVFMSALAQVKLCTYETLIASLDDHNQRKGEWSKPEGKRDVVGKIMSGDKNYVRPLNYLQIVSFDESADNFRHLKVELTEEVPYENRFGMTYFKLRQLDITFDQALHGENWLPTLFEVKVKYWVGAFKIGLTMHDVYETNFDCSLRAALP